MRNPASETLSIGRSISRKPRIRFILSKDFLSGRHFLKRVISFRCSPHFLVKSGYSCRNPGT